MSLVSIVKCKKIKDLKSIKNFPKLQMLGGVDKRILIRSDQRSIDKELEKISSVIKTGGFIPHIDHSIPMDADWYLFREYREKLNNQIV